MATRRYWFALAVFGGLLLLSLPLYLTSGSSCTGGGCSIGVSAPSGLLTVGQLPRPRLLEAYALLAMLIGGVLLIRRYRRAGTLGRLVPALLAATAFAGGTAWLTATHWAGFRRPSALLETAELLLFNGATPVLLVAVTVLALAAGERSLPLLAFAVLFGAVAYLAATYDSFYLLGRIGLPLDTLHDPDGIRQMLNIAVPAGLLLVAALIARLAAGRTPAGATAGPARRGRHSRH
ncbi:hypothetical protein ACFXKJ_32410 [Kitasatospora indigofera]|uniref:hypothetical protein n=1 Tax=Kitasatospora indigofera TaxID=67307 RepID=UPI00369733FD